MPVLQRAAVAVLIALTAAGCAAQTEGAGDEPPAASSGVGSSTSTASSVGHAPLDVHSNDVEGAQLADTMLSATLPYCHGQSLSPDVSWGPGPAGTETFAIHFADVTEGSPHTFWLQYDIPAVTTSVETGDSDRLKGHRGRNAIGLTYYIGPCPEWEADHSYELTVYALDTTVGKSGMSLDQFLTAVSGHILDEQSISGRRTGPPRQ